MNKTLEVIDAVVILSWSNWFTELRSNRYHYATRFARHVPVIFVQPDLIEPSYRFEKTEVQNLTVLRVYQNYDATQQGLLNSALMELNIIRPLLWVYNAYFKNFIHSRSAALKVYHATEDYLSPQSGIIARKELLNPLKQTLYGCDLLIAVSDGVKESYQMYGEFPRRAETICNGCDYHFYSFLIDETSPIAELGIHRKKTVLYQGNIFYKIDFELMYVLAKRLSSWQFNFCGSITVSDPAWDKLCTLPNVCYLGLLTPEGLRWEMHQSTVGIVPFVENEWLVERSFPLKVFEYLATGLPVVTIPIKSLLAYSDVLFFASGVDEFEEALQKAAESRFNEADTLKRLDCAKKQDYDLRFEQLQTVLDEELAQTRESSLPLNIVMLYDSSSTKVSTIKEYMSSFRLYSKHNISYLPATQSLVCQFDLNHYDVVMIHYSVRLCVVDGDYTLSPTYREAVRQFGGYKVLFIQDEYDATNVAKKWIHYLGIQTVYTCVPADHVEKVYPKAEFKKVDFISILTGYTSEHTDIEIPLQKTSERKILIGYRGRALPYWYGSLGREKLNIGIGVKDYCIKQNLFIDIEWDESKRIYGDGWYHFLASARATLGTESGSKTFDFDGNIRAYIEKKLATDPTLSYEDVYAEQIAPYDTIEMNQVSPKLFESIILRTALILFEGKYSGILVPDVHYIPLKKDLSNIREVIQKVQNDEFIDELTERAYQDIIASGLYSYRKFVGGIDIYLSNKVRRYPQFRVQNFVVFNDIQHADLTKKKEISESLLYPSSVIYSMSQGDAAELRKSIDMSPKLLTGTVQTAFSTSSISKSLRSFDLISGLRFIGFKMYSFFVKALREITPRFLKTFARKSMSVSLKHKLGPFIHRFL